MKTLTRKQILGYTAFSAAAGLILAAARAAISLSHLEPGIEMYTQGTALPTILHTVIILCAVAVCTSGFRPFSDNAAADDIGTVSPLTQFASMFTGFLLLAYDFYLIYGAAADNWAAIGPLIGKPQTAAVTLASAVFTLCLMVLAVPSAIHFFKTAQGNLKPSYPFFATLTVVWLVMFAMHAYFDASIAFNSPTKILRILTFLVLAIYAIQETRRTLDIALPRLYFPSAYLAILLGLTHACSDAVLLGAGKIVLPEGYLGIAVELAYVLYILSRLLYLGMTKPKPASDEAVEEDNL